MEIVRTMVNRPIGYTDAYSKRLNKFYFTFGSDRGYPFGVDDYVEVRAWNISEAIRIYRKHHPDRPDSNLINCAWFYNEREFNTFRDKYYKDVDPIQVLKEV